MTSIFEVKRIVRVKDKMCCKIFSGETFSCSNCQITCLLWALLANGKPALDVYKPPKSSFAEPSYPYYFMKPRVYMALFQKIEKYWHWSLAFLFLFVSYYWHSARIISDIIKIVSVDFKYFGFMHFRSHKKYTKLETKENM